VGACVLQLFLKIECAVLFVLFKFLAAHFVISVKIVMHIMQTDS